MPPIPPMGFAKPGRAKQDHVFKLSGGRSLCGRSLCGRILGYRGMPIVMVLDPDKILKLSPGDCRHCVKVFNAVMLEVRNDESKPGAGGTT